MTGQQRPPQPNQPQWQQPPSVASPPPPPSAKKKLREWRLMIALGIVLAAMLWFRACGAIIDAMGGEDGPSTTGSTAPTTAASDPTPTVDAQPDSALEAALELKISDRESDGYDRDEFGQRWADVDRNGCDQRNDVLRRDLRNRHTKPGTNGCVLARGVLKSSPYSGDKIRWTKGDTTIEVDHVVSLADAWRMGADDWSAKKREKFANDPLNLEAVAADENQEKGDKNAVEYRPDEVDAECWFLARQVSIKTKYELSVTEQEKAVMVTRLSSEDCIGGYWDLETSKDYKLPKPKPIGEPKPEPEPNRPEPKQDEPWNRPGPDLDCSDIGHPVDIDGPDYHRLDADGDGVGCDT